jgi:hypothetical protein
MNVSAHLKEFSPSQKKKKKNRNKVKPVQVLLSSSWNCVHVTCTIVEEINLQGENRRYKTF